MAFSDYIISEIKDKFQLVIESETNFFPHIGEVKISDFLSETLKENIPLALAIHTEKAHSEMIVTPILLLISLAGLYAGWGLFTLIIMCFWSLADLLMIVTGEFRDNKGIKCKDW